MVEAGGDINGEESFAALFEESLQQEEAKEGDILKGTVISVGKDFAIIDIGYKSEGQVPLDEFRGADGKIVVNAGDEVDVLLESRENEAGMCVLSKEKADRLKVWDEISDACERDELIEGTISQRVKGGLSRSPSAVASRRSLPGSQVDLRPVRNLDAFIGQAVQVQGHQVQQEARQHRVVPPRAAREGARRAQGIDTRAPQRGAGRRGYRQESH